MSQELFGSCYNLMWPCWPHICHLGFIAFSLMAIWGALAWKLHCGRHWNSGLKLLPDNTPQYLSQMESDLHKTFSPYQDWSPGLIHDVRACVPLCVHAQHMETFTQLWRKKPSFMKNEVRSLWNLMQLSRSYQGYTKIFFGALPSCMHVNVHAHFYIW